MLSGLTLICWVSILLVQMGRIVVSNKRRDTHGFTFDIPACMLDEAAHPAWQT